MDMGAMGTYQLLGRRDRRHDEQARRLPGAVLALLLQRAGHRRRRGHRRGRKAARSSWARTRCRRGNGSFRAWIRKARCSHCWRLAAERSSGGRQRRQPLACCSASRHPRAGRWHVAPGSKAHVLPSCGDISARLSGRSLTVQLLLSSHVARRFTMQSRRVCFLWLRGRRAKPSISILGAPMSKVRITLVLLLAAAASYAVTKVDAESVLEAVAAMASLAERASLAIIAVGLDHAGGDPGCRVLGSSEAAREAEKRTPGRRHCRCRPGAAEAMTCASVRTRHLAGLTASSATTR